MGINKKWNLYAQLRNEINRFMSTSNKFAKDIIIYMENQDDELIELTEFEVYDSKNTTAQETTRTIILKGDKE